MYDGFILMGPFGSGKTYLGHRLNDLGIASYKELEPLVYDQFEKNGEFDIKGATAFLHQFWSEQLETEGLVVFESTGVVQRPLLLELSELFKVGLIWVKTPRDVALARVKNRNKMAPRPIDDQTAADFYDMWTNEIAPTYEFALVVDGTNEKEAIRQICELVPISM